MVKTYEGTSVEWQLINISLVAWFLAFLSEKKKEEMDNFRFDSDDSGL